MKQLRILPNLFAVAICRQRLFFRSLAYLLMLLPLLFAKGQTYPPVAAFQTTPGTSSDNPDTLFVCNGQAINFNNQSSNANAFVWQFGDGNSSIETNPNYTYSQAGTYNAQLIAYGNISENPPVPPDCVPIAIDDAAIVNPCYSEFWLIPVLLNDIDPCEGSLILTSVSGVGISGSSIMDGSILLNGGFFISGASSSTITYTVCNELGECSTAQVLVTIISPVQVELSPICTPDGAWSVLATVSGGNIPFGIGEYTSSCPIEPVAGSPSYPAEFLIPGPFAPGSTVSCTFHDSPYCSVSDSITLPNEVCDTSGLNSPVYYNVSTNLVAPPEHSEIVLARSSSSSCDNPDVFFEIVPNTSFFEITAGPNPIEIMVYPQNGSLDISSNELGTNFLYYTANVGFVGIDCVGIMIGEQTYFAQIAVGDTMPGLDLSSDTASLVIVVLPDSAPDIVCVGTICANDTVYYHTNAICTAYNWAVTGGTLLSGQGTNAIGVAWGAVPLGSLSLSADCGVGSCQMPTVAAIPIIGNNANIEGKTEICYYETTTYAASFFSGTAYTWSIAPPTAGTIVTGQGTSIVTIQWNTQNAQINLSYENTLLDCGGTAELGVAISPSYDIMATSPACLGATGTLQTSQTGSFLWTVSGGIITAGQNSNQITVQWTTAGAAQITATPLPGQLFCNTIATSTQIVLPLPAVPEAIVGETTVCAGLTYTYTASPPQIGTQFIWTALNGTITAGQNTATVSVQWNNATEHSLSVVRQDIGATACSSLPLTLAIDMPENSDMQISGEDDVCASGTAIYNALPTLPDADYNWSITPPEAGSIIQGQGTASVLVQWNELVSTATLSFAACNYNAALDITIHALPQPIIVQADTLCVGNNIVLSIQDAATYTAFTWRNSNGTVMANTPTVSIDQSDVYSAEVSNEFGCTAMALRQVSAYSKPIAQILGIGNNFDICTQSPLNVQLAATDGVNYAFEWQLNGTPIDDAFTPFLTHIGTAEEDTFYYRILVNDTISTCYALSQVYIIKQILCTNDTIIDPTLCPPTSTHQVLFDIQANETCHTITVNQLSVGDFTNFSISWGDGTAEIFSGTSISHTYNDTTIHNYPIVVNGIFIHPVTGSPCYKQEVQWHRVPLVARFDAVAACLGEAWAFQNRSYYLPNTSISTWLWDFGDGSPIVSGGSPTELHTYTAAGNYAVTLTIGNDTCTVSQTQLISVSDLPTAEFSTEGAACANNSLLFVPFNPYYVSYNWQFGDGSSSTAKSPAHLYTNAAIYAATLQTTDERACLSLPVTHDIVTIPIPTGFITATDTLICANETATLTAPLGGSAYLWSSGSTTASIIVEQGGDYTVTVSTADGCSYKTPKLHVTEIPLPNATIAAQNGNTVICQDSTKILYAVDNADYNYLWSSGNTSTSIEISTADTWSLTVTDNVSGCSANSSINSTLQPSPPIPIVSIEPQVVCEGTTALATAITGGSSSYTINWSNNATGAAIPVYSTGSYSATAIDLYGCASLPSAEVELYVMDAPNIAAFPSGCYTICSGDTLLIPEGSADAYQWFFNNLPITPPPLSNYIVPDTSGDYWVIMQGCRNDTSDVLHLTLMDCTAPNDTATLPVTLVSFTGEVFEKGNILRWVSANETNNAYYTLQRSADGKQFGSIATIVAKGNGNTAQTYTHMDTEALPLAYYRLLQTDYDGKTAIVATIVLQRTDTHSEHFTLLALQPIPAHDLLTVSFYVTQAQPLQIALYDLLGRLAATQTYNVANMGYNKAIIDVSNYTTGIYVLQINNGANSVAAKVLIR